MGKGELQTGAAVMSANRYHRYLSECEVQTCSVDGARWK
jgi:hypothetical protein